ncbi:MAG: SRPBCC domain-containing protein [Clostridiales bacterium]|nr:SRPBCC domain-containing protein [Clostridiales bacterium]
MSIIEKSILLKVQKELAFSYFVEPDLITKWLCNDAIINPTIDGAYELFWDLEDRNHNSTIGCRIQSIDAPNHLSFDWKGPIEFEKFMNDADPLTQVVVMFSEVGDGIKVTLLHSGWKRSDNWRKAKDYFDQAWDGAFQVLKESIEKSY